MIFGMATDGQNRKATSSNDIAARRAQEDAKTAEKEAKATAKAGMKRRRAATARPATANSRARAQAKAAEAQGNFFSRKRVMLLIVIILVFDILIVGLALSLGDASPFREKIAPNTNPIALIQSQLGWNEGIGKIGYDSALTKENYGASFTIVDADKLKPLFDPLNPADESKYLNNFFREALDEKTVTNPDGTTTTESQKVKLLYDEVTVGRIIKLNSDWVNYANKADETVFDNTRPGSKAEAYYKSLAEGGQISFNQLAFGTIYRDGATVYALVHARYIINLPSGNTTHDVVFLYKLVRLGSTLVVSDFEVVTLPSAAPTNDATTPPAVAPAQEQLAPEQPAGTDLPEGEPEGASPDYEQPDQSEDGSNEGAEGGEESQAEDGA